MNILKKRKIPDELPELATDKLKEEIKKEKDDTIHDFLKQEEEKPSPPINADKTGEIDIEEGFFNELKENINKEINNLDKLENWYNKKFLPHDVVSDMRDYWENQKPDSVIKVLGKNFKGKITEKINQLQQLEKEWQNAYFDLVEKEEEIREREKELKQVLAEFVELCKRRTKGNKKNK